MSLHYNHTDSGYRTVCVYLLPSQDADPVLSPLDLLSHHSFVPLSPR
jgi:hypothetical protein